MKVEAPVGLGFNREVKGAPAKRHHFVPRLLLRRFSPDPSAKNPPLYRLDTRSGKPSPPPPATCRPAG